MPLKALTFSALRTQKTPYAIESWYSESANRLMFFKARIPALV